MTKYLFTSLFALSLANTSLAQTCSPVAELNENFSTFESGTLPQNCWSSNEVRPRAYVAPKSHIIIYTFFGGSDIYIISPEITEFKDNHFLSFTAGKISGSAGTGTLQVGTLTSPTDMSTFVPVSEVYNISISDATKYSDIKFSASTTAKYIAFKYSSTDQHNGCFLDEVLFKEKPLSVNDAKTASSEISVYPNPAVDVLNIKAKSAVSQYEIYDFTGKKITNGKGEKVNVTNLPKGNYIIRINTENTSSVEKFIKK